MTAIKEEREYLMHHIVNPFARPLLSGSDRCACDDEKGKRFGFRNLRATGCASYKVGNRVWISS